MKTPFLIAASLAVSLTVSIQGQTRAAQKGAKDAPPDLQGVWTNATLTQLERPAVLKGKPTLTEAEAAEYVKKDIASANAQDGASDGPIIAAAGSSGTGGYNILFLDRGSRLAQVDGQIRTSLIVDPPDGKVPPRVTPAAGPPRRNVARASFDTVKGRPISERCLLGFGSTSGPPMLPVLYNNNYQIVQTPDTVMILVEMVHDVRIVRLNGTHPSPDVRFWLGDSIGHYEGDSLVVDTTNFSPQVNFHGSSENLHVIERFKPVDSKTLLYRATIDDPTVFSKPWTVEFPFNAAAGPIYEYACHEGNYAMTDILGGMHPDAVKKP